MLIPENAIQYIHTGIPSKSHFQEILFCLAKLPVAKKIKAEMPGSKAKGRFATYLSIIVAVMLSIKTIPYRYLLFLGIIL